MTTPKHHEGADRPPRPVVSYRPNWMDAIPEALRGRRQWVVWSFEWRDGKPAQGGRAATPGKWTKVLYQPDAPVSRARTNDAKTWGSFQGAVRAWQREPEIFDGVGYVLAATDPFCGIDYDACLDEHGQPFAWAIDLLALTRSTYREVSPSGRGVKAIVMADLGDRKGTNARGIAGPDAPEAALEIYDRGRFFAITGAAWDCPTPATILDATTGQTVADTIYAHIQAVRTERDAAKRANAQGKSAKRTPKRGEGKNGRHSLGLPPADDVALLYHARTAANGAEFSALYDHGNTSGYASESEADGALCCHLAFWTQKDAGRMERLWLGSALGRRDKVANRPDYRATTIATAIEKTTEVYRYAPNPPVPGEARQARATLEASDEFPWTDQGFAERVIKLFGHRIRYCKTWGKWLIWDETRWKLDDTLQLDRYVKATARRMQVEEAATIPDPDTKQAFLTWALACESKKALESALRLLQGQEGIPVTPDQLDANPWLLNCPNGTIDLTTGQLKPHDRRDLITKLCPVEYHSDAEAPLWDAVLRRFLPDDGLRSWADRLFGYALTGTIREHLLAIFYGLGANGKTTILNALYGVLGTDYALKAPPNLLMQKRSGHPTEQASLFGKRLVIAAETGEGEKFNESLVKELTGDEPITARRMREDFWSFDPTHKIILATNHKPSVKGGDNGIWRRLKLVEFGVSLGPDEQDTSVPFRLREEYPGILARAVQSCLKWQSDGLADPPVIIEATREYKDSEDVYGQFIEEICIQVKHYECPVGELYTRYRDWANFNGFSPVSVRRFSRALEDKGFPKKKNVRIFFVGLDLREKHPESSDGEIGTFLREERED